MHIARAFDRGLARLQPPPPYLPSNKPPPRAEKTYLEEVTFSSRPWGVLRIREKSKIAYMGTARMSMPLPPVPVQRGPESRGTYMSCHVMSGG